jgi:hypothetical protein
MTVIWAVARRGSVPRSADGHHGPEDVESPAPNNLIYKSKAIALSLVKSKKELLGWDGGSCSLSRPAAQLCFRFAAAGGKGEERGGRRARLDQNRETRAQAKMVNCRTETHVRCLGASCPVLLSMSTVQRELATIYVAGPKRQKVGPCNSATRPGRTRSLRVDSNLS